MICDKLEMLKSYAQYNEKFSIVADFIENHDIASLAPGRYDLEGGVFLNVGEAYEPYAAGDKWEAHKRYADLQIVLEGDECMDSAALSDCTGAGEYFEEDDYMFYDKCEGSITKTYAYPGTFAYFAPTDPHRPGIRWQAAKVRKAVFKIPI
ncbi:MAG: YhcH/YjgK/YiaL family protein [Clostridia bacterium]|nr:YhcH/YjgK/YiaL family protein [Clostridia bacterium]